MGLRDWGLSSPVPFRDYGVNDKGESRGGHCRVLAWENGGPWAWRDLVDGPGV